MLTVVLASASAHQPHDPITLLAVSPAFEQDGLVFVNRYPDQNWRSLELVASRDRGLSWSSAMVGIDNEAGPRTIDLSPSFDLDGVGILATAGDGAYVTVDGGLTWTNTLAGRSVQAATVAHDGLGPVLIAVGENKIWRSVDDGVTWSQRPAPVRPDTLLRAAGNDVIWTYDDTVIRSADAGVTFVLDPIGFHIHDLSMEAGISGLATENGLWLSEGIADPFTRLLLTRNQSWDAVGVSPGWPAVQTVMGAKRFQGVFLSENGGASFAYHPTRMLLSTQSARHHVLFRFSSDYATDGTAFLATFEGLLFTTDFGRTWQECDTRTPGLIDGMALSPDFATDGHVVVTSYQSGVWVSSDQGDTFTMENTGNPKGAVYDVAIGPDGAGGTRAVLATRAWSVWGGAPFDQWEGRPHAMDYTSRIAFSPQYATDGITLAGTRYDGVWRSLDDGATWTQVANPSGMVSAIAWTDVALLVGTNTGELLRSTDGGATFAPAPIPMLPSEPVWLAGDATGFVVGTGMGLYTSLDGSSFALDTSVPTTVIHQVEAAPDGTRFAAVRGGGLYRSDAGGPYAEVGASLTTFGAPHELAASPDFADDGTVFASIDTGLFRSRDRGDTWARIGMETFRYEEDAQAMEPDTVLVPRYQDAPGASGMRRVVIQQGQTVHLRFPGAGVAFLGATGAALGEAEVRVDGQFVGHVVQTGAEADQVEHLHVDLVPGGHTIEVEATLGDVAIDAFEVDVDLSGRP